MFFKKTFTFSAFAITIGGSFWAFGPAVSGESPLQKEGNARYLPIQSLWSGRSGQNSAFGAKR
jgi:hypothetical protein